MVKPIDLVVNKKDTKQIIIWVKKRKKYKAGLDRRELSSFLDWMALTKGASLGNLS
jgi:hypothetical protein